MIIREVLLKKYYSFADLNIELISEFLKSIKAQWVMDNNIGGIFTWDSSLDDFIGTICSQGLSKILRNYLEFINS